MDTNVRHKGTSYHVSTEINNRCCKKHPKKTYAQPQTYDSLCISSLIEELWHLGCLSRPCLSRHNGYRIVVNHFNNHLLFSKDRQLFPAGLYKQHSTYNYIMISGSIRHFSNWCDMYVVVKVVHRSRSDSHCNRSDTQPAMLLLELYQQTPCSFPSLKTPT